MKETYEVGPGRTVVITVEVTGTEDWEAKLERALTASVKRETELETQVQGYDHDRHTERDRADKASLSISELENQVAELTRRIDNTRIILSDPEVTSIRGMVVGRMAVKMADAIGKALDTLA